MRKFLILLVVGIFILGCSEKTSYVKVVDPSISKDISVEKISERVNETSGLKELQVMGENSSNKYVKLRYRVVWFDKDGFEIKAIGDRWMELPAYKNANFTIHIVAPNKQATDYRLFINQ